jgi:hypothetical protein
MRQRRANKQTGILCVAFNAFTSSLLPAHLFFPIHDFQEPLSFFRNPEATKRDPRKKKSSSDFLSLVSQSKLKDFCNIEPLVRAVNRSAQSPLKRLGNSAPFARSDQCRNTSVSGFIPTRFHGVKHLFNDF